MITTVCALKRTNGFDTFAVGTAPAAVTVGVATTIGGVAAESSSSPLLPVVVGDVVDPVEPEPADPVVVSVSDELSAALVLVPVVPVPDVPAPPEPAPVPVSPESAAAIAPLPIRRPSDSAQALATMRIVVVTMVVLRPARSRQLEAILAQNNPHLRGTVPTAGGDDPRRFCPTPAAHSPAANIDPTS
ncbi:MAG: hypothetical protein DIU75_001100 [Mycolicibacterium hassiacum]